MVNPFRDGVQGRSVMSDMGRVEQATARQTPRRAASLIVFLEHKHSDEAEPVIKECPQIWKVFSLQIN